MYYCTPCATKHKWPDTSHGSHGRCEMCGKLRPCNDVPSIMLPLPQSRTRAERRIK